MAKAKTQEKTQTQDKAIIKKLETMAVKYAKDLIKAICAEGFGKLDYDIYLTRQEKTGAAATVWISGDTKPMKEVLKANGMHWHFIKKEWYYACRIPKTVKKEERIAIHF